MAIVSIYDLDGKEHKRETVDARELEALGWTNEPKTIVTDEVVLSADNHSEVVKEKRRGRKPKGE